MGRAAALSVRMGAEPFMSRAPQAWEPGSMEPELVQERLIAGFDRTSMGVLAELADWTNTGSLSVPGVTPDLVTDLTKVNIPVLLISSDRDGIIPHWLGLGRQHFPAASVEELTVHGFGHCDIILGKDAPAMVWQPLMAWLVGL